MDSPVIIPSPVLCQGGGFPSLPALLILKQLPALEQSSVEHRDFGHG